MRKQQSDPRVDAAFAEAARAIHPTRGELHRLSNRVAALERKVTYLAKRVDVLVKAIAADDSGE